MILQEPEPRARGPRMTRRLIIMLAGCAIVFGGVLGFQAFVRHMMQKGMASAPMPVQTISTAKAEALDWQPTLHAVGSVRAVNGTDLSAEVPGIVEEIRFESGDDVSTGQVLVNLRSGVDVARLREAQAAVELARADYRRYQELAPKGLVSKATLDSAESQFRSAEAQVRQQQEGVKRTSIRAPFGGRIGLRVVDVGQYLNAGARIATLQALDQLLVDFFLPQRDLGQLSARQHVTVTVDAWPGQKFPGEILAVDSRVDPQTRNVAVRARIDNPGHRLLPGMYVSVDVDAGKPVRYVTLPQTAIVFNSFGDAVFLVKGTDDKLTARQAFVKVGPTRGDQIAIVSGVDAGATVVSAGQIKLQDGTPIRISNTVQPSNNPAPNPPDEPVRKE